MAAGMLFALGGGRVASAAVFRTGRAERSVDRSTLGRRPHLTTSFTGLALHIAHLGPPSWLKIKPAGLCYPAHYVAQRSRTLCLSLKGSVGLGNLLEHGC